MKKLRNYIFILLISIFVGLAALFIVYLLPTDRMEANVRSSIDIFYTEGVYPQQAKGYKSSQLDNETDAIRLCAPAPVANNKGITPNTKAKEVIRIGRKRTCPASKAASLIELPSARKSRANSTIKIPFFAESATNRIMPICVC